MLSLYKFTKKNTKNLTNEIHMLVETLHIPVGYFYPDQNVMLLGAIVRQSV